MNVILGIVVGSFGIKGDIKVKSCTDFASKRYKKGNVVKLINPINQKEEDFEILNSIFSLLYSNSSIIKKIDTCILDENTLIVISAIGAYFVGKISEGIMVITLYEIGKILESKAVKKTRKSISDLMNIKPEYANLKINEEIKKVNPK